MPSHTDNPHPNIGSGMGTAPGVRHRDMHPLTKARVDRQAEYGRALAAYAEANRLLGRRDANESYVNRKKGELMQALERLIEAAQHEGMGE
jgi:hypothetical protein